MTPLTPAYGSSSGASATANITNDHIFSSTTERDTYFSSNSSELKEGIYSSSDGVLQKYVDGAWVDVSQLLKGADGANGINGISSYPQYSSDNVSFHDTLDTDNDIYIRYVTVDSDGSETYSSGKMFVGQSGGGLTTEQLAKVDAIEEVYTSTEKTKVASMEEVFTADEKVKVAAIEEVFTSDEKSDLASTVADAHTHSNIDILDNTTASFTEAYETKLANMTDRFKGVYANSTARDAAILLPVNGDYCKQSDTNSFWFYGGTWVDSGSTSTGDMLASMYDPQGIADDSFDRANHTGAQSQSTITDLTSDLSDITDSIDALEASVSTLSTEVDSKQNSSTVLDNTTEAFTTELLERIEALESSSGGSSSGDSGVAYFSSTTQRNNGTDFTADAISPLNTMTVASSGLFTAPYDGIYRVDVTAQGSNNNTTVVLTAGYSFLYSINGATGVELGNCQIQFERVNWVNATLTATTFDLVEMSAGDTLMISTESLTQTSVIKRYQVMIEYKGDAPE